MTERILRRREVEGITGLSRSTIYALIQRGDFPAAIRIGRRAVGWRDDEVMDWIKDRERTAGGSRQ